jgi:hypothetical protein
VVVQTGRTASIFVYYLSVPIIIEKRPRVLFAILLSNKKSVGDDDFYNVLHETPHKIMYQIKILLSYPPSPVCEKKNIYSPGVIYEMFFFFKNIYTCLPIA